METPTAVVLYTRSASVAWGEEQLKMVRDFAEEHGWTVAAEITEKERQGMTENAIKKTITDLKDKPNPTILMRDHSRISRDLVQFTEVLLRFSDVGINVVTIWS